MIAHSIAPEAAADYSFRGELVNKAFRVFLLGIEDVVGKNAMSLMLREAGLAQYINNYPPSTMERGGHKLVYLSKINRALLQVYGMRGLRAILQRVGRVEAQHALSENAAVANATKLAIKFLGRHRQIKLTLDTFARQYSKQTDSPVEVHEMDGAFYVDNLNCGQCLGWEHESPVCFMWLGMIHGLVAWAIDNNDFKVEEVECVACGDKICRYRVSLD